jgi:hypothetical protein
MIDLSNVKVGDKFMVGQSYGWSRNVDYYRIVECESMTDKQCTIGGYKYRKSDGKCIGGEGSVMLYDDDLWKAGQKFLRHKKVEMFKYHELTDEQRERIYKIIMEPKA